MIFFSVSAQKHPRAASNTRVETTNVLVPFIGPVDHRILTVAMPQSRFVDLSSVQTVPVAPVIHRFLVYWAYKEETL